jgi:hypothetical protein
MLSELYEKAKDLNSFENNNCVVGQWRATLSDDDKKVFDLSIADTDFSTRRLYSLYQDAGCTFGLSSLNEHRNGKCGCR